MQTNRWHFSTLLVVVALAAFTAVINAQQAEGKVILSAASFPIGEKPEKVEGWSSWSHREQTRPDFLTAELPNLDGPGCLMIGGASNSSANGCWTTTVKGIEPGKYYKFEAWYASRSVPYPRQQIFSRLDWIGSDGERVGQPDYVVESDEVDGDWKCNSGVFLAPEKASAVELELYLSYCPQGTVWWDRISLTEAPAPQERKVRVGSVYFLPNNVGDGRASVASFIPYLEEAGRNGCDIVCIGEGINMAGVSVDEGIEKVHEPIPGPTTEILGEVAKKYGMYIIGTMGEQDGNARYNTGVLIDREGRVSGKYRKVYLPREEIEAGRTPGDSYPVFETDFGRIGIMICWDVQYTDPARALAVQGAEIIFLPIWDGIEALTKARAIENQVFLVTSSYHPTMPPTAIYGHWGEFLAKTDGNFGVIWADLDLNAKYPDPWLGDMRNRFIRERRADIKLPALEN